jgi:hypothetical protein
MRYTVIFPFPERTVYHIDSSYPEKAKREAASIHKSKLPRLSILEISLMASCFRDNPKTAGGRHKNPELAPYIMNRPY